MEKYFYACWSCLNTNNVITTLNMLRENKYLFYYDEGYKNIACDDIDKIVKDSHFVLVFIDKNYLERKNIISCLESASKYEKDVIVVNLFNEVIDFKYKYKYMFNDSNCYTLCGEFSDIDLFKSVKYGKVIEMKDYLSSEPFKKDKIYRNDFYKLDINNSKELYFKGLDYFIDKKIDDALFYLNKAKDMDNPAAINLLSWCYTYSFFDITNYDKANELRKEAKELGSLDAKFEYAKGISRFYTKNHNYFEALDLYMDLAMSGKVEAFNIIGESYEYGKFTVIDYHEAYKWYKRGSYFDSKEAMFNLAKCYLNGKGIEEDNEEGMKWLKKSANNGHSKACLYLSNIYYSSYKKSSKEEQFLAFHYCLMAALSGDEDAEYKLSSFYSLGIGVEKDELKAREWLWAAACDGHKWARYETDYPGGTEEMINKRYKEYVFEKK